jgi:hypothetical protein
LDVLDDEHPEATLKDVWVKAALVDENGNLVEAQDSVQFILYPTAEADGKKLKQIQEDANFKQNNAMAYKDFLAASLFYKEESGLFDIAIIKLQKPFTTHHVIAKIWPENLQVGDEVTYAGYGDLDYTYPDRKMEQPLQLLKMKVVEAQGNNFLLSSKDESGLTPGDSGGPLFLEKGGELYVAATHIHTVFTYSETAMYTHDLDMGRAKKSSLAMNMHVVLDFLKPFMGAAGSQSSAEPTK